MKKFLRNRYDSFYDSLLLSDLILPISGTDFIPQGICTIFNNFIVSCYDAQHKENSILFLYSNNGWKRINLDCQIHCGGICYHEKTDSLFITGKGVSNTSFINRYSGKKVLEAIENSTVNVEKVFCVDDNGTLYSSSSKKSSVAYITCYEDSIFLGNFVSYDDDEHKSYIKKYHVLSNGDLSLTYDLLNNPFTNTQGVCIYECNSEEYYLFSRSFGRKRNSIINICKLKSDRFIKVGTIVAPCMSEQINVYEDNICLIFESCAKKYSKSCLKVMDKIYILDFNELISKKDTYKEFNKGTSIFVNNKQIPIGMKHYNK